MSLRHGRVTDQFVLLQSIQEPGITGVTFRSAPSSLSRVTTSLTVRVSASSPGGHQLCQHTKSWRMSYARGKLH